MTKILEKEKKKPDDPVVKQLRYVEGTSTNELRDPGYGEVERSTSAKRSEGDEATYRWKDEAGPQISRKRS